MKSPAPIITLAAIALFGGVSCQTWQANNTNGGYANTDTNGYSNTGYQTTGYQNNTGYQATGAQTTGYQTDQVQVYPQSGSSNTYQASPYTGSTQTYNQGGYTDTNTYSYDSGATGGYSAPATSGGSTYTVQKGDNLYQIGRRHGTTANAIKAANNLTSDVIHPGEVLTIR